MGFSGVIVVVMAFIFPGAMLRKMKLAPSHSLIGALVIWRVRFDWRLRIRRVFLPHTSAKNACRQGPCASC
jgi:hypothetical protein